MKLLKKNINFLFILGSIAILTDFNPLHNTAFAGQKLYYSTDFAADTTIKTDTIKSLDSIMATTKPLEIVDYQDLNKSYPYDLKAPSNVQTTIEYDVVTGNYIMRSKVGDMEVSTPFVLSEQDYRKYAVRQDMQSYWKQKNREAAANYEDKFNLTDMKFSLGAIDKVFGPGGVQIKTQGSAEITLGVLHNNTQNYLISERLRKQTQFDFKEKIQMNVQASVGDRIKFGLNYDTESTFDFDRQNLKLAYEGKEDDWIKKIEAGNVAMKINSQLIPGANALFGIRGDFQFGKLSVQTVVSQQQSQSQNVNTKGGVKTQKFDIPADQYDANTHYFLAQHFRATFDKNMEQLPHITSGVIINRIEVWVTNKRAQFDMARNIVAFTDIGERDSINKPYWIGTGDPRPSNGANNLYGEISNIPNIRDIQQFTQIMSTTYSAHGIVGGSDYEKIESARLLDPSEYTLNQALGFLSLRQSLQPDEVLAVAFEYTIGGKVYQVGEFSTDGINSPNALIVKLLKSTTIDNSSRLWDLMMKNVYSLGASSFQADNFKLDVLHKNDSTGIYLNYINAGNISNQILLKVMNLDRLDIYKNPRSDGKFDFVEGYTIISSMGRVIFPVIEPFGSHLRKKIGNDAIADKYVFQELYDSTLVAADAFSGKNKFKISGEFQGTSNSEIYLNAMNIPRGAVKVTASGVELVENVDYTIDYIMGVVNILNQQLLSSNTPIDVKLENREMFSMQRKTLVGTHLEYAFNKNFSLGGTIMHLSEMPLITKTPMGSEPIANTIWGLNAAYKKEMQWLTTALDKLPLLELSAPSSIQFNGEVAQMIPGHKKIENNPGYAYLDDFEATETTIDVRYPYFWHLASTPADNSSGALFPEASLSNNVEYGKNRALFAWYSIDNGVFNQETSTQVPNYMREDKNWLSNNLTRAINAKEVFPNRESTTGQVEYIPMLNISFYPKERGPYNLDLSVEADGSLQNPKQRWGGMMRKLDNSDFEQANIEYIEFWMMDPFVNDTLRTHKGGDLYFNLGDISEDVLKDGKKFFENGMPTDGNVNLTQTTVWGKVPTQQSTVLAFSTDENARQSQDVGFNGLKTSEELEFDTYKNFTQQLRNLVSPAAISKMEADPFSPLNDPAQDNYHHFRGSDYDQKRLSILERYKRFNGTEGNSAAAEQSGETYSTSASSLPDAEDINQDNTLSEFEKYFQYKILLKHENMTVGSNFITDVTESETKLANGQMTTVKWYQFKIPIRSFDKKIGNIRDFKSIRFMRLFLTNFEDDITLRFASMELIRGEWRNYTQSLSLPNGTPSANATITIGSVNIEENANKNPVNYVLPPGVERQIDAGQPQLTKQNEQAMSMRVFDLGKDDAKGAYKKLSFDMRQYRRLQMFTHAEKMLDDVRTLNDYEISVFLRVGSDLTNNYYEYEIPLKLTPQGYYSNNERDRNIVWYPENMFDFRLSTFTDLKKERNAKRIGNGSVSLMERYTRTDPEKQQNLVTVVGNPNLGEVQYMMVGVRNRSADLKSAEVWINELRLTDYNEDGGWAALGNLSVALSDFANVNVSGRFEQTGFGAIDQNINNRRLDDYSQVNFSSSLQLGKLFPEKSKVKLPVYYSYSVENSLPKYSPLDGDILLKEAMEAYKEQQQKDSLIKMSQTRTVTESFNVTGAKVDIRGKRPQMYDPANFSVNYAYQKSSTINPSTERNANVSHQGSINYEFNTQPQTWEPFKNSSALKSNNWGLIKNFGINYSPSRLVLSANVARQYSETQLRDLDGSMGINKYDPNNPLLSSSKNFTWGRNFDINWDFTKNLRVTFQAATNSRIDETKYAPVNKRYFPDEYQDWKDTVLMSLKHLGEPLTYQQGFNVTYNAPINQIPFLEWLSASASYNSTYSWNRGAIMANNVYLGNSISNNAQWQLRGEAKMEDLYNKVEYLKSVNQKYNSRSNRQQDKRFSPKSFSKTLAPSGDSVSIVHNLNSANLQIEGRNKKGRKTKVGFEIKDNNTIVVFSEVKDSVFLKITTVNPDKGSKISAIDVAHFTTRFFMMIRSAQISYNQQNGMLLPGFDSKPSLFGQSLKNGIMLPGLDFAFGMPDKKYIEKAVENRWLIKSDSIINPASLNHSVDLDLKALIEPFEGLKINLSARQTNTKTNTIQYMFDGMPTQFNGSFQMTYISLSTAFWAKNTKLGNVRSFELFNQYRSQIADQINQRYRDTRYPTGGFMDETTLGGQPFDEAKGKSSPTSADAMIPAFLAAYSNRKVDSKHNIIPKLWTLMPNWTVSYDGLSRIPFFAKHLQRVTLNHAYTNIYAVNSYTSFANFITNDSGFGFTKDIVSGNPIPSTGFDVATVSISENFAPLFGVDITFRNSMTVSVKYNKMRTISLNIPSIQIGEIYSNEFVVGFGYIIKDFDAKIKLKANKVKRVKNNLTARIDFSIKDMATLLRKIDSNEPPQATSGNKMLTIKSYAEYVFSSKLNFRLFFDYTSNAPIITTSYPMSNINAGLSIKFMLTR